MATGTFQVARLVVADLDRSVAFYEKMFGFSALHTARFYDPVVEETFMVDSTGRPCFVAITSPTLEVTSTRAWSPLVISVDDTQKAHDELVAAGYEISMPLVMEQGMGIFMVRDPDGYNLEIVPNMDMAVVMQAMAQMPNDPVLNPAYELFGHTPEVPR